MDHKLLTLCKSRGGRELKRNDGQELLQVWENLNKRHTQLKTSTLKNTLERKVLTDNLNTKNQFTKIRSTIIIKRYQWPGGVPEAQVLTHSLPTTHICITKNAPWKKIH